MPVLLAGVPCLDPAALLRDCRDLAIDASLWAGKANAYTCPDGPDPGEACVLLSLSALKRLDQDLKLAGPYDLTFASEDAASGRKDSVTVAALVVTSCECVVPGARDDDAPYLLTMADRRLTDRRTLVDVGFNLADRRTGEALAGSTAATWQGAVTLLAENGDLPGVWELPEAATPDDGGAGPQDLEYWQWPALDALADLLARRGCRVTYDPVAGTYRVALAGADDAAFDDALASLDRLRVWDAYPRGPLGGSVPATLRVLFARRPHARGDGSPWYAVDAEDPEGRAAGVGTVTVHDDTPAEVTAGVITNSGDLDGRAAERAAFWFDAWHDANRPERLVFAGALPDAGLLPGPRVTSVRWSDTASQLLPGRGVITEVRRRGPVPSAAVEPRTLEECRRVITDDVTSVCPVISGGVVVHLVVEHTVRDGCGNVIDVYCVTDPTGCCGGAPDPYPAAPVVTGCCDPDEPTPARLYMTLSSPSGACADVPGTITLDYSPAVGAWVETGKAGTVATYTLRCNFGGGGWQLDTGYQAAGPYFGIVSCAPFEWHNAAVAAFACAGVTADVVISETPPSGAGACHGAPLTQTFGFTIGPVGCITFGYAASLSYSGTGCVWQSTGALAGYAQLDLDTLLLTIVKPSDPTVCFATYFATTFNPAGVNTFALASSGGGSWPSTVTVS